MSTAPQIVLTDSCDSTSSRLIAEAASLPHGYVLAAREQTGGRGQRGNSWEAAPGQNLTFSMLLRPAHIPARRAFELSMVIAVALADALENYLPDTQVQLKWPNDIYVGDRKLGGILIENAFRGQAIERMIVGVGINVNQDRFVSDAPNPVSLTQLTGRTYDLEQMLTVLSSAVLHAVDCYDATPEPDVIERGYHARLWRREGVHRWRVADTGEIIEAAIWHVELSGHLCLATEPPRRFAFKEIAAIL